MSQQGVMRRGWAVLAALVMLLGACAAPTGPPLDPSLFPRASVAPEKQVPIRVALLVPPQVAAATSERDDTLPTPYPLQLPIGRIVEKAAAMAFGDALKGGLERVDEMPAPSAGYRATLVVDSARCVHRAHLLWLLPVPYLGLIGDTEFDVRVSFDLRLLDGMGRTVWTRTYDSGRQRWRHDSKIKETVPQGIGRLAHENTWRLMQQAVTDLRDWVEAERLKPREL